MKMSWVSQTKTNLIVLIALVVLCYANTIGNGFVSDDIPTIVKNPVISDMTYFVKHPAIMFLRPFLLSIVYHFSGTSVVWYHVLNIACHCGAVVFAYLFVSSLSGWRIAFMSAALFAVHPVAVESVAWVSGGSYSQAGCFSFAALFFFTRSLKSKTHPGAALVLYALALLSSEKSVVLFAIFALIVILFGDVRRDWRNLIVFALVTILWGVAYSTNIGKRIDDLSNLYYQPRVFYNPLLQIPVAITSYLNILFWPDKLTIYHTEMTFTWAQYAGRLAVCLVIAGGFCVIAARRSKTVVFWMLFFVICLSPTLLPFGLSWIVAERYVYFASLSVFVLVSMALEKIPFNFGIAVFAVLVFILGVRCIERNKDWRNADALWISTAKTSPSSYQNHNNLGDMYARQGDYGKACFEFSEAIRLKHDYADAYHNLGHTLVLMGRMDDAVRFFEQALTINTRLWQSRENLAYIYASRGEIDKAVEEIKKAISVRPDEQSLIYNLDILTRKKEVSGG